VPGQNTAQANNLIAGNYTVTVTDDHGCTATTNVALTEPNFQLNTATAVTICDGQTANLTANSLDGAAPVTYTWTNQNNGSVLIGNVINPAPSTNVNYEVIATDANGCLTSPVVVSLTVNPTPVASFVEDVNEGCQPLCVTFNAASTLAGTNWQWDFGDAQTGVGQTSVNCFKGDGFYTVSLTAVSNLGCSNTIQKNDLINVYKNPKALFSAEPKETTLSNPQINFLNQSVGAEIFYWNFGDKDTSTLFQTNHNYEAAGNYCIRLIAQNDFGCIDSTKDCIKIKPNYTLFVPNSFTPNGDGLNDEFMPLVQSVKDYEMSIFNRWGLKVFTTQQLEIGWDGGSEPQGAFNYVIQVTTLGGEQKIYTGSVTLYR
jgi:gliding motility-associated-like protein